MTFSVKDWIHHPAFGDGQIAKDRGDKFDIRFPLAGDKTILKSVIISPGSPPRPDFEFPRGKSANKRGIKVARVPSHPPLEFDYLVKRFLDFFDSGFEGELFKKHERELKEKPANKLHELLSKEQFHSLLEKDDFDEIAVRTEKILRSRLLFPHEKIRLVDALKKPAGKELFAKTLWELLYGGRELQLRFEAFADMLQTLDASSWTTATYFQFLQTRGQLMFMKPGVTKKMADSLAISLNYRAEPNWLTYSKLQELATCIKDELEKRGLHPNRMDVQGFIWASIKIAEDTYGPRDASV